MSEQPLIDRFVSSLRRRLNRFRFLDLLIRVAGIAAVVLLAVSLVYLLRGYAVAREWYVWVPLAALAVSVVAWILLRRDDEAAARFADDYFGLKDAVSSYRHFRRQQREGEVYELQGRSTSLRLEGREVDEVKYTWPRRLLWATCLLVLVCTGLAFKEASPEVIEKLKIEEETAVKTEEINDFLEELVKELEEDSGDLATELDPAKVREWVEEMKGTTDRGEAMRQYAELERKMQEAAKRLDQRKQEHLLAKAGEELQKAEEQEPRALGKKLEEKKFREASEDLAKLQPEAADPEKLDERRKELAKLKSAAQRMASAAQAAARSGANGGGKSQASSAEGAKGQGQSKGASQGASGGASSGEGGKSGEEDLEGLLTRLDDSVKKLDESLKRASQEKLATGQCSAKSLGQCQSDREAVLSQMKKLSQSLCRTAARSQCQSKLLSMCQKLGQCQGYLGESKFSSLSQCLSPGQGKGIGAGSVDSRREPGLGENAGGELSQLQGIKSDGPGETSIEAADDGDGVTTRRGAAREREFAKQVESFVRRDDVPEAVKEGVKEYFKRIHQPTEP